MSRKYARRIVQMIIVLALILPRLITAAEFACAGGDVACLINSINMANVNGETNTITLGEGTYTLREVNNITPDGPNGLPAITSPLTIIGGGTTPTIIERPADAPDFRLVYVASTGTLTLAKLILRGEGISNDGTLIFVINILSDGGGINNDGTLFFAASTLSGGGGINNDGTLSIINSTFSGGGGINNDGALSIVNSTFTGGGINNDALVSIVNSTLGSSGNISNAGWLTLQNTILVFGGGDCENPVISLGHNLVGDPTSCPIILSPSDLIGPPGLGPFTDNGNPGNGYFPLLLGSPAIDSGDNAVCPATDQLWHPRVGVCDIGAIEFAPAS